jgi:hypothetical protein
MLIFIQIKKSAHPDLLNVRDPALPFIHTIPVFTIVRCNTSLRAPQTSHNTGHISHPSPPKTFAYKRPTHFPSLSTQVIFLLFSYGRSSRRWLSQSPRRMFLLPLFFAADSTAPLQFSATSPLPRPLIRHDENVSEDFYDCVLSLHSSSLDPHQHQPLPNSPPPILPQRSHPAYIDCGPFRQIMHRQLSSTFLSRRVN